MVKKKKSTGHSDLAETAGNFFEQTSVHLPTTKVMLTLRLDSEVVEFFKKQGKGYQTRINTVLRAYVDVHAGR